MAGRRRLARRVLRVIALLAALIVGVLLWLHTSWGRQWLLTRIELAIASHGTGKVTIGELDGSLLGTPTLRRIAIIDEHGRTALRAKSVKVDYALWPLLSRGTLHLRDVTIEAPDVQLSEAPDGTWNLARIFAGNGKPNAAARRSGDGGIRIDAIHAVGGHLSIEARGWRYTFAGLALAGRLAGTQLVVDSLTGRWEEAERDLRISGTLDAGDATLRLTNASLACGSSRVVTDTLDVHAGGALDVELHASDLQALAPALPAGASASLHVVLARAPGQPDLQVVVDGRLGGLTPLLPDGVTVAADASDYLGRWAGKLKVSAPQATLSASGSVVVEGGHVRLDQVECLASTVGIRQSSSWSVGKSRLSASVSGTWPEWTMIGDLDAADVVYEGTALGAVRAHVKTSDQGHSVSASLHAGGGQQPLGLDADVSGKWSNDSATVRIGQARAHTSRLVWKADGGEVVWRRHGVTTVRGLHLGSAAGLVDVEGEINGHRELRVRFVEVDFARLREGLVLDGLPVAGRVTGEATIHSGARGTTADLDANATAVQLVRDARPFAAHLSGHLRAGRAALSARLSAPGMAVDATLIGHLPARGVIDLAAVDEAQVMTNGLELADLWPMLGLRDGMLGRVTQLDARWQGAAARLDLSLDQLRAPGSSRGVDATIAATLAGGVAAVRVSARDADSGDADLSASVTAPRHPFDFHAWRAMRPVAIQSAELTMHGLDLEAVAALTGRTSDFSGHLDARVSLPAGGTGLDAHLEAHDTCSHTWKVCLPDGELHVTLDRGLIGLDGHAVLPFGRAALELHAAVPHDLFDLAGWRALDDRAVQTASIDVTGLDLARLAPAAQISGEVDARLRLAAGGPLVLDATAREVKTPYAHRLLGGRLHVEMDDDATRAHAETSLGSDALVRADGALALGRTALRHTPTLVAVRAATAHADAHIDAFPLRRLADELGLSSALVARLGGTLHFDGTLDGSIAAPVLSAGLELGKAHLDEATFAQLGADARWRAGRLDGGLHARQANGGQLDATLTTGGGASTDASITASAFDVGWLAHLLRAEGNSWLVNAGGLLEGSLHASGTASAPAFTGTLRLEHGHLQLRDVLAPLDEVRLALTARDRHLDLTANARSGRGSLALRDGHVELDGWLPRTADGTLETQDLRVVIAGWPVNAGVTTRFTLDHDRARRHWDVRTDLDNSTLEVLGSVAQPASFTQLEDVEIERPQPASARPRRQSLALKIRAQPGKVVTVTYDLVQADATPTLDLDFADGGTRISGDVLVRAGDAIVEGVPYDIRNPSWVRFGQGSSSPTIDATLEHNFSHLILSIHVRGPIDRAKVTFESNPANYTQEQLLSFVMGGNPDVAVAGTSTASDSALSAIGSAAFSALTPFLKTRIMVGIDEVDADSIPSRRYSLGAWIHKNLFLNVRYRSTVDVTENTTEGQLQWHLGHGFMIEIIGGSQAGSGDILWIWRP
jgi:hypothetical protein